ncbi:hypothetical protein CspeluHIS016_0211190 [Cutaneotrichosporon spelunceum]|uniref:Uncharacterized protein n=1 Tax=Cutaneotrichosporon spelunceum TaxID=1672016 RepID=A0AAD3YBG0_9TREE|nr:hypothetical protein CspeluHIS016_0211190 [Cutaneotrichosporon spelunceum]
MAHRRTDSLCSVSSVVSDTSSTSSGEWVYVDSPTPLMSTPTTTSPPSSPGGRRHSVGLGLAPSLCDFNPSPHRPTVRPQLRPLILAAKYPLNPSLPLL